MRYDYDSRPDLRLYRISRISLRVFYLVKYIAHILSHRVKCSAWPAPRSRSPRFVVHVTLQPLAHIKKHEETQDSPKITPRNKNATPPSNTFESSSPSLKLPSSMVKIQKPWPTHALPAGTWSTVVDTLRATTTRADHILIAQYDP